MWAATESRPLRLRNTQLGRNVGGHGEPPATVAQHSTWKKCGRPRRAARYGCATLNWEEMRAATESRPYNYLSVGANIRHSCADVRRRSEFCPGEMNLVAEKGHTRKTARPRDVSLCDHRSRTRRTTRFNSPYLYFTALRCA